jgi:beta-galactosidase GanA
MPSTPSTERPIPRIVQREGRYALFVDDAPYLLLGAQVNNSSSWPAVLPKVWPAIEYVHANTVEMPIYWEQFEPQPGQFDSTVLGTLLAQARDHGVHLVLLWFGTWKNGSGHYMPSWMKRAPERYPRMTGADGYPVDSPSPYAEAALEADCKAFAALMQSLKTMDGQRTVVMVQVENEPGTWGSVRDYSPAAQKLFDEAVPEELLVALHVKPPALASASAPAPAPASASAPAPAPASAPASASAPAPAPAPALARALAPPRNWRQVFGEDADEFFHAWSVGRYVGKVAAAGKAVYPLPLYANAALRDPLNPGRPPRYESGGPTDNVIAIWKAAAPALDLVAPDIYMSDSARYLKVLELYDRPDNPLFVPETGHAAAYARYFFAALSHRAIGFSPFGIDYTGYTNAPLGAARLDEEALAPFALNYRLVGPMDREIARLAFEGHLQAAVEETGRPLQTLEFGSWTAVVSYGLGQFGPGDHPPGNGTPVGRALVGQLEQDEFLVAGFFCRVDFRVRDAQTGKKRQFLRVEEGVYGDGAFHPQRIWNGDQTDWGLNLTSAPQVLRVALATF